MQQTFLYIVDDTICIHINTVQDCEHMHYIINPALPWYVYLITALLLTLFMLCFGRFILHCYRAQRTRQRQNAVHYVVNPVFEEDDEEETYEVPVTRQQ